MEPNYVVVIHYQTVDQKFWSGSKWVTEYPDAEVYTTAGKAPFAAFKVWNTLAQKYLKEEGNNFSNLRLAVIEDYGNDDERAVLGLGESV